MKRYRVNEEIKQYLRKVLLLNQISFWFEKDKTGTWWCHTTASSNHFRRMVMRARCEKATEETGLLHVTYKESLNRSFTTALMAQRGVMHYVIIDETN